MTTGDPHNPDDAPDVDVSGNTLKNPESERVFDDEDETWALVLVQWRDAHQGGDGSWTDTDTYEAEACMPISVGWVWPRCKPGYLTLVSTVMNHADNPEIVSDVNHIPWENVTTIYSLAVHMPVNWRSEGIE